jgi:hypothetical protein
LADCVVQFQRQFLLGSRAPYQGRHKSAQFFERFELFFEKRFPAPDAARAGTAKT